MNKNITALTFKKYALPLVNLDLKINCNRFTIDANGNLMSPYSGMSITQHHNQNNGLGTFGFNVIIDGNNGTAEKIYEFVQ
jgi:hypothetical protein